MEFKFNRLAIPDVIEIEHGAIGDARGFFAETYRENALAEGGIKDRFLQESHSRSAAGILRGLHYQLDPRAQGKLVRCSRGRIWDVAVDIRAGSPYYKRWVAVELSDENRKMLWVPPGFAHGFFALTDCDMIYKQTDYWAPELDRGIRWDDPELAIAWPGGQPSLSPRDQKHPFLKDAEINFRYAAI
ncbi:MAG: dTDP-4-dehydrorhamnose 3,5-epimerase [Elusimicrobia bacterium]|nr:dTDP-4-dehydrorhamnose 3,5-epimerase [Elusimicrobiota bacterium]